MFLYSVNVQSTKTKIALLTENSIPFSHLHRIVRSLYTIYAWRHACVHIYDFINKDFVWVKAKQTSVYVYERIVVMSEEMRYKFRENKRTIRNRKILNSRKSCKKIIFFFHIRFGICFPRFCESKFYSARYKIHSISDYNDYILV